MKDDARRNGVKIPAHLAFIRRLPCAVCGFLPSEAAHYRANRPEAGKLQALAKKPSDVYVTPLCSEHHRTAPTSQHNIGEEMFWRRHGIDPLRLAELLFAVTGDFEHGESIVRQARRLAPWKA